MTLFLRPNIVVWIAEHLCFQHLGLLCRTSRVLRAIVSPSWDVWVRPAQQMWGASAPWDVRRMRIPDEIPVQFAQRVVCPWVQPSRAVVLQMPTVPDAAATRAWRIELDEQRHLQVTFQYVPRGGGFLSWGDEGFPGMYDIVRSLPARPLAGATSVAATLSDDERDEWDAYLLAFCGVPGGDGRMRYDNFRDSCWRLHAGVVVAAFSDHWTTRAGLGFFATRDRRLLHFHLFFEEVGLSCEFLIACPGEMWMLERWAGLGSQLEYYGAQVCE
jgi:hypothetical protein